MSRWRAMTTDDLRHVGAISDAVHGRFTEPVAVYAERLHLYPAGCLAHESAGTVTGYCIGHPWRGLLPPALGGMLGHIPVAADSYYLHDLALMPGTRGLGAGAAAVARVRAQARAEKLSTIHLVAVNGAESFWQAQGFAVVTDNAVRQQLRNSYGEGALPMTGASSA